MAEIIDEEVVPAVRADLRKFNKAEEQVTKAVTALAAITVTDAASVETAIDTLKRAKSVETVIENKRKELVGPLNDEVKKINQYAKDLAAKLPPAIDAGKNKVLDYQTEQRNLLERNRKEIRGAQLVALGMILQPSGNYTYENIIVGVGSITALEDPSWNQLFANTSSSIDTEKARQLAALNTQKEELEFFGEDADKAEVAQKIEEISKPVTTAPGNGSFASAGSFQKVKGTTKTWTFDILDAAQVPMEYLIVDETKIRKAIAEGARTIPGVNIYQKEGLSLR